MSTVAEIESAMAKLTWDEQQELIRRLAERVPARREAGRRLPLVPATGRPITQAEIDDALEAD